VLGALAARETFNQRRCAALRTCLSNDAASPAARAFLHKPFVNGRWLTDSMGAPEHQRYQQICWSAGSKLKPCRDAGIS